MDTPLYPAVPGQPTPDLGLASYRTADDTTAIDATHGAHLADSSPSLPADAPSLSSADPATDIHHMGSAPGAPAPDLQLANEYKAPPPGQLAEPPREPGHINRSTSTGPGNAVPELTSMDLTGPGIDHLPAFMPDPSISGLLDLDPPGGIDLIAASRSPLALDPTMPGLDEYVWPVGLVTQADISPDPMLPDLRQPDLEQQVHMQQRPGDLAAGALDEMHRDATYQRLPAAQYRELWMQQAGDNQARERHMGMLMRGLAREEQ